MKNSKASERDSRAVAHTLSEALPMIRRYDGAIIVIKLGGHAMSSDAAMSSFARDIVMMRQCGLNPVVVHGGGPMINDMLARLDINSEFVDGKRVTDEATVEVVEMVLSGRTNKRIVQAINMEGGRAIGISGKDAGLMICTIPKPELGLVGQPAELDVRIIKTLIDGGFIPVIAPLGAGQNGQTLNVNGDTAAGAIAGALKADRLLLLTDVAGVKDQDGNVLTSLSAQDVANLTSDGIIAGGMIPKTQTALDALNDGVRGVAIIDGREKNACLLELFTDHGAGSLIKI